jgi:simple sugar transport system ATP-binding protein
MRIELTDIHKRFGPVHANAGISITFQAGSIHGLLGENGAGKSTLMKILSGYYAPDSGEVRFDGRPVKFATPAEALRHGVGMLHQDPLDFPPFQLLDNFILGRNHGIRQRRAEAQREFVDLCRQFQFDLDPEARVSDLTVGERQQLEIARLLWLGARALILDEPTTGISAPQKVRLFATLKRLAEQGKTIIFVSHKLADVEELCHRVTVLARGRITGHAQPPYSSGQLVQMMFGQIITAGARPAVGLGGPLLELDHATFSDHNLRCADLTLNVAAGEVIGLAGLEGSGQKLLLQGATGLLRASTGTVRMEGADLTHAPYHRFLQAGVAYVPADRMTEGLIPGLTIEEHMVLARRGRQPAVIDWKAMRAQAERGIGDFNIKGRAGTRVEELSGGNQQRTLLALLAADLRLLALEHPTRGLDVESALYIWSRLLERRRQGTAILFASADLDEIMQYSDRILVFFGGHVLETLRLSETTTEQLGYLIGGKKQ